jgi:hypothetical protein
VGKFKLFKYVSGVANDDVAVTVHTPQNVLKYVTLENLSKINFNL